MYINLQPYIIAGMIIFFAIVFLVAGVKIHRENRKYWKESDILTTEGIVIDVIKRLPLSKRYGNPIVYEVFIEFYHNGKRIVFIENHPYSSPYQVGQKLSVVYNANNPTHARTS